MADITIRQFKKHGKYAFLKEKQGSAKNSFIRFVLVKIDYDVNKQNIPAKFDENFKRYCDCHFHLIPPLEDFWNAEIVVKKIGSPVTFKFSCTGIFIEIDAKSYSSFLDDVMPSVQRAIIFVQEVLEYENNVNLTIRKINHFNFNIEKYIDNSHIEDLVFSEPLQILTTNKVPKEDIEKKYKTLKKYRFVDINNNQETTLRTLVLNSNKMRRAILDIETTQTQITLKDIYFNIRIINHTQYLAFLWAVTTNVLKWMYQQ